MERYDEELCDDGYDELCNIILEDKQTILIHREKQRNGIQKIYYVKFKNKTLTVVWDDNFKYIKTVLPKETLISIK